MPADTTEYIFDTKCGRHFRWSATSMESLFRECQEKGYVVEYIWTLEEYEALQKERELKESA